MKFLSQLLQSPLGSSSINSDAIAQVVATPREWVALAISVTLMFVAGGVARYLKSLPAVVGWRRSARRLIFPSLALALLLLAAVTWRFKFHHHSLVLALCFAVVLPWVLMRVANDLIPRFVARPEPWMLATTIIGCSMWILSLLLVSGLTPDIAEYMAKTQFPVGKTRMSLQTLTDGLVHITASLIIAGSLALLLESRLSRTTSLHPSTRTLISRILWVILIFIALMVGLSMAGIDLTILSLTGGGLAVGIGFGMQKIAANYVAGITVLLDRSLQVGQVVGIHEYLGKVVKITTRYTVIREFSGREVLVPNEMLVTSMITNETYSEAPMRQILLINVSYESDIDRALAILLTTVNGHTKVFSEPPPLAFVDSFGSSGIMLKLIFWIRDYDANPGGVCSDINIEVWRAFREEGIEMPYHQIVMHQAASSDAPS